jgi:hypothetical protein
VSDLSGAGPTRRDVAIAGHRGDEATARAGLDAADPTLRAAALGALQRLGRLTGGGVAAALADPDPVVRRRAATIAAQHPDVELLGALGDPDESVVEVAAWACGERETAGDDVLRRLCELATSPSVDALAREASVAALGAIGDDRGLDAILAGTSDKPAIRRRAVLALAPFLDAEHPRAADVGAALRRALEDRDWQVRQAAEDLVPPDF